MSTSARSQIVSGPTTRTGLILAAGFGSRLAGVSDLTRLKPLTPVGGVPLMQRTLDSLAVAGCSRVVVVTGFRADEVEHAVEQAYSGPLTLEFVRNPRYELSNGVSVLAARPRLPEQFVLTMADHVFGDEVMNVAGAHSPDPGTATLLVDYKLDSIFDLADATKVFAEAGRVRLIGKQLDPFNAVDTGLFVGTSGLLDAIAAVFEQKGDASLSDGVSRLAALGRMTALDIGAGFWQDVDTPEMLAHAGHVLAARYA